MIIAILALIIAIIAVLPMTVGVVKAGQHILSEIHKHISCQIWGQSLKYNPIYYTIAFFFLFHMAKVNGKSYENCIAGPRVKK